MDEFGFTNKSIALKEQSPFGILCQSLGAGALGREIRQPAWAVVKNNSRIPAAGLRGGDSIAQQGGGHKNILNSEL